MSSWPTRQSEVVGGGTARHGSLFRALVPLPCDGCGATISIGDTFTRRSRASVRDARWGRLLHNVCGRCGRQGPSGTPEETSGD